MASSPHEIREALPVLSALSDDEITAVLDQLKCIEKQNELTHREEMFRIRVSSALLAVPFVMFVLIATASLIGSATGWYPSKPDDWLINLLSSVMGAAIAQIGVAVFTLRRSRTINREEREEASKK